MTMLLNNMSSYLSSAAGPACYLHALAQNLFQKAASSNQHATIPAWLQQLCVAPTATAWHQCSPSLDAIPPNAVSPSMSDHSLRWTASRGDPRCICRESKRGYRTPC